jgi:hypothetical protein
MGSEKDDKSDVLIWFDFELNNAHDIFPFPLV